MKNKKAFGIFGLGVIILVLCLLTVFVLGGRTQIASAINGDIYYGDSPYFGVSLGTSETETINYATKTVTTGRVNPSFPNCYNLNSDIDNVCANVAGANIINYYDRFYDDLIPSYTSGAMRGSNYIYYGMPVNSDKKQQVINTLNSYMRTNIDYPGTTQDQYKQGLMRYVNEKNKNVTYTSILSNNQFDLNKFIAQIQQGNPVTLYLSGFNITSISDNGSTATLYKSIFGKDNHIMIAYGYQKIDYYNNNGALILSKTYLEIAPGLSAASGVYIVNNNGTLNDAEAVHIY